MNQADKHQTMTRLLEEVNWHPIKSWMKEETPQLVDQQGKWETWHLWRHDVHFLKKDDESIGTQSVIAVINWKGLVRSIKSFTPPICMFLLE